MQEIYDLNLQPHLGMNMVKFLFMCLLLKELDTDIMYMMLDHHQYLLHEAYLQLEVVFLNIALFHL